MMERFRKAVDKIGSARFVMVLFLLFLVVMVFAKQLDAAYLFSNALLHIGMSSFFVLSMVVTIITGTGLNFGLPLGLIAGLFAGVLTLEWKMTGWAGVLTAIALAMVFGAIVGFLYGRILVHVKGSEMVVGNYIGQAFTFLMCIAWMFLPFTNKKLTLVVTGFGLKEQVPILEYYAGIIDNFLSIHIGSLVVPLGMFLIFGFAAFLVWLLFRTRYGIGMSVSGANPKFARSLGINEDNVRVLGSTIASMLAAVGIIIYSQSYGYYMIYTTPKSMAFPPMAAILIGGASTKRASLSNVIIGLVIYYTIITLASPVAGALFAGDSISEPLRVVIQNGVVLYSLTKIGEGE